MLCYIQLDSSSCDCCSGQLSASCEESTGLRCTARLYHQAMDECQRLQSENIALRQMLQNALDNGSKGRARSSSRGRNQTRHGGESASSVLKPGLSFVAERGRSVQGRSCSPPLSRSVYWAEPNPYLMLISTTISSLPQDVRCT